MKDSKLYLIHIKECIERIESYTQEGPDVFFGSKMQQDAVIRNFEIIGEAVKKLPLEFKEQHSQIPWKQMAGFRDVLIHDYMGVEIPEVWGIIEQNLPDLKKKIEIFLQD